jgi:hypothetical protein
VYDPVMTEPGQAGIEVQGFTISKGQKWDLFAE